MIKVRQPGMIMVCKHSRQRYYVVQIIIAKNCNSYKMKMKNIIEKQNTHTEIHKVFFHFWLLWIHPLTEVHKNTLIAEWHKNLNIKKKKKKKSEPRVLKQK